MREGMGLYRGKRLDNGEWVEGNLLTSKDGASDRDFAEILVKDKHGYGVMWHEVDMETIGQWTGLVDKNGVKVFEGDIIKTDNGVCHAVSTVKYGHHIPGMFYDMLEIVHNFRPKQFVYGLFAESERGEQFFMVDNPKCIEVIGNIHDKKEDQ